MSEVKGELVKYDVEADTRLIEAEKFALRKFYEFEAAGCASPLAKETSDRLYELFKRGTSCRDIQRLNRVFGMGQIVHARVRDDWDGRLVEEDAHQGNVPQVVRRMALDTAEFLALQLAAAHKLNKDKLLRFLQTGDEAELGDLAITNISAYNKILDMLMKVTGQDQTKKVQVSGGLVMGPDGAPPAPAVQGGPLSSDQAAQITAILLETEVQ